MNVEAQWTIPSSSDLINEQKEKFSAYENADSSIKVDYPSSWTFSEISNADVEFHPPDESSKQVVKVSTIPITSNFISMKSIVEATLKDKSSTLNDFNLEDSSIIPNAKKMSSHKLVYSYTDSDNTNRIQVDFGILDTKNLYLLSFISIPEKYYSSLATVDRMISSLIQYSEKFLVSKSVPQLLKPVSENVKPLGDPNAKIALVEFADYRCPFCHKFHEQSFDKIVQNFVDKGMVKFLYKDFVVNDRGAYKGSNQAALASYCAAEQNKYWEFSNEIFNNFKPEPQQWITLDSLTQFATNVQIVDIEKFKNCVQNGQYQNLVDENNMLARSIGLSGTPGFVLLKDNELISIIPGAVPYETFANTIAALNLK